MTREGVTQDVRCLVRRDVWFYHPQYLAKLLIIDFEQLPAGFLLDQLFQFCRDWNGSLFPVFCFQERDATVNDLGGFKGSALC